MSTASTAAKQRWNKEHYSEIKASLRKDLVSQFKARCKENKVSIASVLADQMEQYCAIPPQTNKKEKPIQLDTRSKRRKTTAAIARQLEDILMGETTYRSNIPANLENSIRAESADNCIEKLTEALDLLREAYEE